METLYIRKILYLHQEVIATEDIEYGNYFVYKGDPGTVIDYGETSQDPVVKWAHEIPRICDWWNIELKREATMDAPSALVC